MNTIKNRIPWIDVAKGLGILTVVIGHSGAPKELAILIYAFHMPLFFFLSGFLFSTEKHGNLFSFVKQKIRSLIVPYFCFSFITYLYFVLKNIISPNGDILKSLIGIFYANGINGWMDYDISLWFLPCLFVTEISFFIITKLDKNQYFLLGILFISSIIGYLDSLFMPFRLPWSIDVMLTAIVFFGIGYLIKDKTPHIVNNSIRYMGLSVIIFTVFVAQMIKEDYMVDLNYNKLFDYYNFYLPAASGIVIVILISMNIKKSRFLSFLGKDSLIILALHHPVVTTVDMIISRLPFPSLLRNEFIWNLILATITIVLMIPAILIINRYFSFILGKKTKKTFKYKLSKNNSVSP